MPHYADGKKARIGDLVLCQDGYTSQDRQLIGQVVEVQASEEACNLYVTPLLRLVVAAPGLPPSVCLPAPSGQEPQLRESKKCERLFPVLDFRVDDFDTAGSLLDATIARIRPTS